MTPEQPIDPASIPDQPAADGPDAVDPTSADSANSEPTSAEPTAAEVAALDAVRAADPAAGTTPDLPALHAALARAGAPVAADELAPRRTARRPARWVQVAAVAAGLVLLGAAGGYAAGSHPHSTADGGGLGVASSTGDTAKAPSVPQNADGSIGSREASQGSGSSMSSDGSLWYGGGQRTVYTADGLTGSAGTATAWGFDAAATFSSETAARLADALDVPGKPQRADGWTGWTVGDTNGAGRTLVLNGDGTTTFTFNDGTKQPWNCPAGDGANGSSGGGSTGSSGSGKAVPGTLVAPDAPADAATAEPAPSTTAVPPDNGPIYACTPHEPAAPTGQGAIDKARALMDKLGAKPSAYRFTELQPKLKSVTNVQAELLAGGVPTGVSWSFTEVSDGFASVTGQVAPLVDLGAYPVVSPKDAVARLTDPRFGSSYVGIVPAYGVRDDLALGAPDQTSQAASDAAAKAGTPTPTNPGTATPGAALPWPVRTIAIDSATLGLLLDTDGRTARLVPAYHLTSNGGGGWDVMAVDADRLDTTPAG